MTAASNVVFCELSWTPAENTQAEDRVYRYGQDQHCSIYYLNYKNSIDDYVARINFEKDEAIKKIF